jgi:hypothetical protein
MKNSTIVVVALLALGVGFLGGMQYQKTQAGRPIQGQFRGPNGQQVPGGFQGRGGVGGQGMIPVSGEIINQDDTSITIKMEDGSSKIVVLSTDTNINRSEEAAKSDLKTGERITALGTTNSDGSITAQNISIGGNMMFRVGPGR